LHDMSRREFESYFNGAVNQALRIVKDRQRAQDVAAEAMGRLITDGKNPKHFKLIVNGLAVDEYRRMLREQPWGDLSAREDLEDDILFQAPPLTFEQVEFRADFDQALRDLEFELDRQAFLLTTVRGLTLREAAEILDIDHTSVFRHAERARAQIKEALA
jgi:RNA polymerase sigma factor (sigma-70 family)